MQTKIITVKLNKYCYDIVIGSGLIAQAVSKIKHYLHQKSSHQKIRLAIVTDKNVAAFHLNTLQTKLAENEIYTVPIIVEAGEQSKSFPILQNVIDKILVARLERSDSVIALGVVLLVILQDLRQVLYVEVCI
ncbi:3-dehydroquinate synthase [Bartonella sp. WD16.2]|nr:3-dehydroquinate synthase [Bartonella sp. WD16.2]